MASWWATAFDNEHGLRRLHEQAAEDTADQVALIERELGLAEGSRVLDVPCGTGRHAVSLAARGHRVTCVDLSEDYLDATRRRAVGHGVAVDVVRADMRDLTALPGGSFDAAVNMYTSFGYFDRDEDNARAAAAIARVLRPGGRLLVDVVNRDWFVRNFFRSEFASGDGFVIRDYEEVDGEVVLHQNAFDPRTSRLRWTCRSVAAGREHVVVDYRMYSLHELLAVLRAGGLHPVRTLGGYDGRPYELFSPRLLCVAGVEGGVSRR
ncbi:class I SAM-dependent methyltransferase [Saccharothrix syringae]|uniref:Class I SAM-dependent methyltransferase n=1 Tax=Saccharothrix syringae TaxID=103733 RepID=A0A5Q0H4W3_SACSY|nr:class I SAM-dependent methyltransferase [Saccharothrix syringae]QFZ20772.1 class I SAM-dependent methyltransferase [Saccharothrix syringae]